LAGVENDFKEQLLSVFQKLKDKKTFVLWLLISIIMEEKP